MEKKAGHGGRWVGAPCRGCSRVSSVFSTGKLAEDSIISASTAVTSRAWTVSSWRSFEDMGLLRRGEMLIEAAAEEDAKEEGEAEAAEEEQEEGGEVPKA